MAKIDIGEWAEFTVGELFTLQGIKQAKSQKMIPTVDPSDGVPYVVQSQYNNMVSRYVDKQWLVDHNEAPVEGNAIVLGVTLNACSYQPDEFGASQVITARSPYLNQWNGFFIASVLRLYIEQFDYQEKPGLEKYKALVIKLPATANGEPDWAYMDEYMSEVMQETEASLEHLSQADGDKHAVYVSEWREFIIGDLFEKLQLDIKNANFNKALDVSEERNEEFNLPLVNAKHGNNGIMYYGRESDFDAAEMTIDIVQNGAIATGDVYAQPQKTGVLWDAYLIKPKANIDSALTLMFLATVIEKSIKDKFSYDDKCVWDKAKLLPVSLPVDIDGAPDWAYMEEYMGSMMENAKIDLTAMQTIF